MERELRYRDTASIARRLARYECTRAAAALVDDAVAQALDGWRQAQTQGVSDRPAGREC